MVSAPGQKYRYTCPKVTEGGDCQFSAKSRKITCGERVLKITAWVVYSKQSRGYVYDYMFIESAGRGMVEASYPTRAEAPAVDTSVLVCHQEALLVSSLPRFPTLQFL